MLHVKRGWVFALLIVLSACSEAPPPEVNPRSTDTQIAAQITALHEELKLLRQDMAAVRQAVTEIHRSGVRPPPVAPAKPVAVDVKLDADDPAIGSPEAELLMVEFSDFQCPYCRRYQVQVYPEIKKRYIDTGKVRYVYRDFPLGFHQQAPAAAVAATCAARQGKFEEMKEALFLNQRRLGGDLYVELATASGLDVDAFQQCLEDKDLLSEVDQDLRYGSTVGVSGTPTFFIGRLEGDTLIKPKRIVGAQPLTSFLAAIDALLENQ